MAQQDWQKYLKFRCTGCGNCCRDTVVCITDGDIKRIVDETGKSPLEFVRFYTQKEISMSTSDPLWVKFNDQKAVMALRSIEDRCVFLDDKTNFCTIYEHRPVTCRDHPFNVTFSGTGAVEKFLSLRLSSALMHGTATSHAASCAKYRPGTSGKKNFTWRRSVNGTIARWDSRPDLDFSGFWASRFRQAGLTDVSTRIVDKLFITSLPLTV